MSKRFRVFLLLFFSLCLCQDAIGQSFHIKGSVKETFSKSPLAFVHIVVNQGEKELLSGINGEFDISSSTPISSITFSLDMHRTVEYEPTKEIVDSIKITLNRYLPFFMSIPTDSGTFALVKKIILTRKALNIEQEGGFSYSTYNKFTFTYDMKKEMSQSVNLALKLLFPRLKSFEGDHHLLLVESVTEKDFKDAVHQKETVLGSKISGFDDPSLLALSSSIQHFSIYDDFILMGAQRYLGPLHWNAFKRYTFNTVDTIHFKDSTIYVVKFMPKPRTHFDAVKGFLYIHKEKNAILHVQISPITNGFFTTDVLQSYVQDKPTQKWVPLETRTLLTLEEYGPNKLELVGSGRTYYHNFKPNKTFQNRQFNEYVLEYADSANIRDSLFWQANRKENVTKKDLNTFLFFKKLGNISSAERWIRLGENLFIGKIPIGPITLELNKIINFNNYESVRFGLGFHTNERLSKYFSVGGFLNYGTRDQAYKWGGRISFLLNPKMDLRINYAIGHDLAETGIPVFAFDRFQFSSEPLRKYQVQQYDFNFKNEFSFTAHPFKYLDLKIGAEFNRKTPTYNYRYTLDSARTTFQYTDVVFGLRYAYGEQYLKTLNNKIFLGTKFPVLYFQMTKSFQGLLGGEYDYWKCDAKIEYRRRIIGFGTSFVQLIGGIAVGNLPYPSLYVGRGAFRNLSVVMHNSFETMRYNEFISDRYLAMHYSHIFGKLHLKDTRFQPEFEMLHNIGFGSLINSSLHERVSFNTMEKGFFESGIFVNNIISLRLGTIKIGFGTGVFCRYGAYQLPVFSDNLVFKLSVGFYL